MIDDGRDHREGSALIGAGGPGLAPLGEPRTRTDLVGDAIKVAILNGSLPPGHPLSERDLAARLGVSQTPVREALKLLRATGLVELGDQEAATTLVREVRTHLLHVLPATE